MDDQIALNLLDIYSIGHNSISERYIFAYMGFHSEK